MSSLRVQVDSEVADALQTECELLGFDGPEAYLAWIVENRAAIEQGTEAKDLLGAYRERLAALEARLATEGVDPEEVAGEPDLVSSTDDADVVTDDVVADDVVADDVVADDVAADDRAADDETAPAADERSDGPDSAGDEAGDAATVADGAGVASASGTETTTADASTDDPSASGPDGGPEPGSDAAPGVDCASESDADSALESDADSEPESDADSEPEPDADTDPASATAAQAGSEAPDDEDAASDGFDVENLRKGSEPVSASEPSSGEDASSELTAASDGGTTTSVADVTSMHLRPERVQRVNEDPVARDAGELADVETRRVDELSRKAVAETRDQLDRDVETGLSYSSSTELPGSDVCPGEDVADLDEIDVPGRSEDLVAERREVVGRALALLRDEGRARRSDVVAALYEEHPAGYETADGWWRCVREGLGQVEAVDGGHVWEFVG